MEHGLAWLQRRIRQNFQEIQIDIPNTLDSVWSLDIKEVSGYTARKSEMI